MASKSDPADYRKQAAEAAAAARDAAVDARIAAAHAAKRAKEWAGPQYDSAKEWLGPRAKHYYHEGARRAEPYVRKAGDRASDWSDAAHAAIVGAAIPAVIAAVDSAAHADAQDRRGSVWPKVLIPVALAAAATAALVVWARRDPGRDAWAGDDEWEFAEESEFKAQLRDGVNRAADAATDAAKRASAAAASAASAASEVLSEKAGPAVTKVKDTAVTEAKKVADAAGPAVTKVKDTAVAEAKKVRVSLEEARSRAAEGLADTLDDAEDVWEDEGGSGEDGLTPAEHLPPAKPAARKPAAK